MTKVMILGLALLTVITGCNGGGSGQNTTNTPPTAPPPSYTKEQLVAHYVQFLNARIASLHSDVFTLAKGDTLQDGYIVVRDSRNTEAPATYTAYYMAGWQIFDNYSDNAKQMTRYWQQNVTVGYRRYGCRPPFQRALVSPK